MYKTTWGYTVNSSVFLDFEASLTFRCIIWMEMYTNLHVISIDIL